MTEKEIFEVMRQIAERYEKVMRIWELEPEDRHTTLMDLECIHDLYPKFRWIQFRDAPSDDFNHDIFGIKQHLNRTSKKLKHCWEPRYAS